MKIPPTLFQRNVPRTGRTGIGAFTLPEVLVAMAIFVMMITGVIFVHIYGLKLNQLVRTKLGASDEARRAISKMVGEIRGAGMVKVGTGTVSSFVEATGLQQGNAIHIYPKNDTNNNYVRYFWDSTDKRLKRTVNGGTTVMVVANSITNSMLFTAQDYRGRTNTDNSNNRVIDMTLQFYQLEYPTVPIGPGSFYDFYQLRTKIARRATE